MSETPEVPGTKYTPLTREEYVAKEKALANMKAMTMRRGIFKTLRPCRTQLGLDELRKRSIALIVDFDKNTNVLWTYILLDDQSLVRGAPYPLGDEGWPQEYQYMLELPRVQVA
jgi:hypothetical protein